MYSIKFNIDTWLKLTTGQGSTLPEDQRQFIDAETVVPLSSFQRAENNHLKIVLGKNQQGQQLQFKGKNTWYVYGPAVELLQQGQTVDLPTTPVYSIQFEIDTWLKLSTDQGDKLPDDQRQFIQGGTVLPLSSFQPIGNHLKISLGQDEQGKQVQFKGRNTWFVYEPAVDVLKDGESINLFPPPAGEEAIEYTARFKRDTWLKLNTGQSSALPEEQKQLVRGNTVLPISSYRPEDNHFKLSFGKDKQGTQVQFKGRNTWYAYGPDVELLQDGKPIDLSLPPTSGKTNEKGLRLLKAFEGLRLVAYLDAVGVWTIGYGTTSGVRPGMRISKQQAEEFLKRDLNRFEAAVTKNVRVPLNSDQFSALVSFTYNVGEAALASSTLVRKLNQKDYSGAANEFLRWNKGGRRVLPGLTRRRKAERALFLGENYMVFL